MKKFTKITLIIAAVFAALGITLCCVGVTVAGGLAQLRSMAQSGTLNFGNWHFEDGFYYKGEDILENVGGLELDFDLQTGGHEHAKKQYTQEIRRIEMDLDLANVLIQAAEQDEFTIEMENGYIKHYEEKVQKDTLIVNYDVGANHYKDAPDITIYVPAGCVLEDIIIDTDLGNINVHDCNINENCYLVADMGNAEMTTVICEEAELHSDMGRVYFEGTVKWDLKLTTDMGSAEARIVGEESDYNIELYADMGQVHCNGKHHAKDMGGEYRYESSGAQGTIFMESSMGEVKLNFE